MPQDDPEAQAQAPLPCAILEGPGPESNPGLTPERNPRYPNLVAPWKRGDPSNPGSRRKGKPLVSVRTLEVWIRDELRKSKGKLMGQLARAIIDGAIAREPACLNWLGDRLWKLDQGTGHGHVTVYQGIRLELPNAGDSRDLQPLEAPLLSVKTDVEGKT